MLGREALQCLSDLLGSRTNERFCGAAPTHQRWCTVTAALHRWDCSYNWGGLGRAWTGSSPPPPRPPWGRCGVERQERARPHGHHARAAAEPGGQVVSDGRPGGREPKPAGAVAELLPPGAIGAAAEPRMVVRCGVGAGSGARSAGPDRRTDRGGPPGGVATRRRSPAWPGQGRLAVG